MLKDFINVSPSLYLKKSDFELDDSRLDTREAMFLFIESINTPLEVDPYLHKTIESMLSNEDHLYYNVFLKSLLEKNTVLDVINSSHLYMLFPISRLTALHMDVLKKDINNYSNDAIKLYNQVINYPDFTSKLRSRLTGALSDNVLETRSELESDVQELISSEVDREAAIESIQSFPKLMDLMYTEYGSNNILLYTHSAFDDLSQILLSQIISQQAKIN